MKRNRDILFTAILFLAAFGLSAFKIQEAAYLRSQYSTISIRFEKAGVTESELKAAERNEKSRGSRMIPEITAWSARKKAEIKNPVFNRCERVPVLIASGDTSEVAPMKLLSGNYLYQEDGEGCIIDSDTAYALYHTRNAVTNSLIYQNRKYYIRGIVKTNRPLFIILGNSKTVKYQNLELKYKNMGRGEALSAEFLSQNSLPANYVIIDSCFYSRVLYSLLDWSIWIFYLALSFAVMRFLWKKRSCFGTKNFTLYCIIILSMIIGYGLLLYSFVGSPAYIPGKFVPSKCSDFDYWSEQFKLIQKNLTQMQYLPPNARDVFLKNEILRLPLNFAILIVIDMAFLIKIGLFQRDKKIG